jgi:putative ABC transport system substrate-binding protein
VVFGSASGPVESGIVPAYATPESHITGVTSNSIELVGKRLEILREVLPQVKRVVVIGGGDADSSVKAFAIAKATAPKVGFTVLEIRAGSRAEAIEAAKKLSRSDADAIFLIPSLYVVRSTPEIAEAAKAARLPFVVYQIEHVEKNGALLGYGSSYFLQGKQSAKLLSKVLKGVKPGEIPIETPDRFVLTLNLATAKAIGFKVPRSLLDRADRLVE